MTVTTPKAELKPPINDGLSRNPTSPHIKSKHCKLFCNVSLEVIDWLIGVERVIFVDNRYTAGAAVDFLIAPVGNSEDVFPVDFIRVEKFV